MTNKEFPAYPSLEGKSVLVTGGRSGIGLEIARMFSKQNSEVTVVQRTEFKSQDPNIKSLCCDFNNTSEISTLCDDILENGKVDILINNAASNYNATLSDIEISAWESLYRTNVTAPLYLTSRLSKGMVASNWGRIINISSISIYDNTPFNMLYAATKSSLSSLTRSWARQLAKHNITVNAITPGFCETEFTQAIQSISEKHQTTPLEAYESVFKTFVPTRKSTSSTDIAATVLFLCADHSSNITGESVNVCGGQFMMS